MREQVGFIKHGNALEIQKLVASLEKMGFEWTLEKNNGTYTLTLFKETDKQEKS